MALTAPTSVLLVSSGYDMNISSFPALQIVKLPPIPSGFLPRPAEWALYLLLWKSSRAPLLSYVHQNMNAYVFQGLMSPLVSVQRFSMSYFIERTPLPPLSIPPHPLLPYLKFPCTHELDTHLHELCDLISFCRELIERSCARPLWGSVCGCLFVV